MSAKAQQETGEKKKKKLPLPLIIGVLVLVVALFVGKSVMGSKTAEKTKKSKKSKASKESSGSKEKGSEKDEEPEEIEVGHSMALEEFMVNLSGGGDHYLRTTIALGLKKGLTEEKAKEHVNPIRDAILTVLTSKSLKDLSSPKGRDDLKVELVEKINEVAGEEDAIVGKVYFTAFATQ